MSLLARVRDVVTRTCDEIASRPPAGSDASRTGAAGDRARDRRFARHRCVRDRRRYVAATGDRSMLRDGSEDSSSQPISTGDFGYRERAVTQPNSDVIRTPRPSW